MNSAQIEIQLIALLVSVACAIPGTFLVLRKMALITDAISHAILPGLVIGFFITHNLNSPLLIFLATLTGLVTVALVSYIQNTGLVKEDTAIGLVFPALFSIGVLLIALRANDVHLDTDAVLLGEIAFAPFDRWLMAGIDLGPKAIWIVGSVLVITVTLMLSFYKELKVSTFDPELSAALGFSPVLLHYGLMGITSVTTVVSFEAVGAILVVALMIAPAASAYLLTDNLKKMMVLAIAFGAISAIAGYWTAHWLDASIAGSISTILGLVFLTTFLFSPRKGLWILLFKQKQQQTEIMLLTYLLHLRNHSEDERERQLKHLHEHINWSEKQAKKVLKLALKNNFIWLDENIINLTDKGLHFTESAIHFIISNETEAIEDMKNDFFLFRG